MLMVYSVSRPASHLPERGYLIAQRPLLEVDFSPFLFMTAPKSLGFLFFFFYTPCPSFWKKKHGNIIVTQKIWSWRAAVIFRCKASGDGMVRMRPSPPPPSPPPPTLRSEQCRDEVTTTGSCERREDAREWRTSGLWLINHSGPRLPQGPDNSPQS